MGNVQETWGTLSVSQLQARRQELVRTLPPLEEVLRGSLFSRRRRCGKPNCRCVNAPGHGPYLYLSHSRGGSRPKLYQVSLAWSARAQQYVDNLRQVQQIIEEICQINLELLRRRADG